MEQNPTNPQGEKAANPRSKGGRRRKNVLEFEFAQGTNLGPVSTPEPATPASAVPPAESPLSSVAVPLPPPSLPSPPEEVATPKIVVMPDEPQKKSAPLSTIPAKSASTSLPPLKNTMSTQPLKPSSITDFKRNVDQQKKEQKSLNNVLSTITYVVLIGLVLVSGLTGYGAYEFWLRLNDQATSISTLDQKLDAAVLGINEDLRRTKSELEKSTEENAHQEEEISILRSSLEKALTDARADRAARARENASLQRRVSDLENHSR